MGESDEGEGGFRKLVSASNLLATPQGKAIALQEWMSTRLDMLKSLDTNLMDATTRSVLGACHGDLEDITEGHTQHVTKETIQELENVCKYHGNLTSSWQAFFNDALEKMIQLGLADGIMLDPLPPKEAAKKIDRWIESESALYERMNYVPFKDGGKELSANSTSPRYIQIFKEALYGFYAESNKIQDGERTSISAGVIAHLQRAADYPKQLPLLKTMAGDIARKIVLYNLAQGKATKQQLG